MAPVAQTNDLALLPQPFFDRRDVRPLELPIVFNAAPNAGTLQAAGTMSSWFGALAGFRGAKFPSLIGELPARGNAVVMVAGRAQAPAGLALPEISGPTVAVVSHPADRNGKLLLVMGRDDAELAVAAKALAIGSSALSGPLARITEVTELKPRITVFGVGGAGGNAVNNMIESRLEGVEFVVATTDAQALLQGGDLRARRVPQLRVEIAQRLVQQQDGRVHRQ